MASLPVGPFRSQLLLLEPAARDKALRRLARFQVPKEDYASLRVTPAGDLFYVCDFPPPAVDATEAIPGVFDPPTSEIPGDGPQAAPVPISSPPVRHSRPGATKVLYLDFNGHTITGTSWNSSNSVTTYVAKPYDTDSAPTTFSDAEQAVILSVWSRVAEDYAPFDVDVTTEEPAVFDNYTARALVTANVDANGVNMPSSTAGGVAYLSVYGEGGYATTFSPALIYFNNLGSTNAANIAEALSHEVGHNLGLSHDGRVDDPATEAVDPSEYYGGHGTGETSWGPLMGTGYGRNVSQWSKGEYYRANNTQDDFAIIASSLAYRTDETGDAVATAVPAALSGGSLNIAGVLVSATDADVYVFNAAAGTINLTTTPFVAASGTRGNNADLKLELLDASGAVVASADPATTTGAALSYGATAGKYFIRLSASAAGDPLAIAPTGYTVYGSAGQYTVTGSFAAAAPVIVGTAAVGAPAGHLFTYSILGTNAPTSYAVNGLPAGLTVDAATGVISGRPLVTGVFNLDLSATNALGTGTGTLTLTVTDAAPAITAQTTGRQSVGVTGALTLSVTALSANGSPTYQWRRNGQPVSGATNATLSLTNATVAVAGWYQVYVTNSIGTTRSAPIFVQVVPLATGVVGWGFNTSGQTTPPGGLTDAIAVAGGGTHALALKADGTVVAWGGNAYGQATVPSGLSDVVAIAAGAAVSGASPSYTFQNEYSLALKGDGTVVGWGDNVFGQINIPAGLANVVAIAAGTYHVLALKADGTVVGWGYNGNGQTTIPVGLNNVVAISAGLQHSLALKADGTVVAWGYNGNGEINVPVGLSNVIAIEAGGAHSLALKADGTVSNWGFNSYGVPPVGFVGTALASGRRHSVGLKTDRTVAVWPSSATDGIAVVPAGLTHVFGIAGGRAFTLALRDTNPVVAPAFTAHPASQTVALGGSVTLSATVTGNPAPTYQWYKGATPISGATGASYTLNPVAAGDGGSYTLVATNAAGTATSNAAVLTVDVAPVVSTQTTTRRVVAAGEGFTHTVSATGTAPFSYQWYRNNRPLAGATSASYAVASATASDNGAYHVVVTDALGSRRSAPFFVRVAPTSTAITVWGDTASGQGTVPGSLTDAVAISAGTGHVLALRRDGTVVAWGLNTNGQATVPGVLSEVVAIFAGSNHSLALRSDGTVVAWGWNASGQANVPGGLANVIAIAGGDFHSYALKTDGTVVGWGNNTAGQTSIPGGLSTASVLGTGASHALVVTGDEAVVSWGNNGNGQATVPGGLSGILAVEGGNFHSVAAKTDGTVTAWGSNSSGQTTVPGGLSSVTGVAAGGSHSLALKSDGTVVAWGLNTSGQATVPGGVSRVFEIAGGGNTSLALRDTTLLAQTVTFAALPDVALAASPLTLNATASSGLPVTFIVVSGPASVVGSTLTLTGAGTVVVRASQTGDSTYSAATPVDRSFAVFEGYAAWRLGKFTSGELANATVSGPNADPDGDGYGNLLEYALGLEPKTASAGGLPEISVSGADWVYTYTRPSGRSDLTYGVEISTNLNSWTSVGVTHEWVSTASGLETWRARYPLASAANLFFRLRVMGQ